jgi:hypothetical protein
MRTVARSCTAIVAAFLVVGAARNSASPPPASGGEAKRTVVLELFTSQGCSSCPPADALLSRVGRERFAGGVVIPLAFHVDYWNRIGWTDPFSSRQWSERQGMYAAARQSSQVYTPQLVLNGDAEVVGNSERAVRAAIEKQLRTPQRGTLSLGAVTRSKAALFVEITAALPRDGSKGTVYVALVENGVTTNVRRGENSGRALRNDHIVRSLTKAFEVGSGAATQTIQVPLPPSSAGRHYGVVAFVQDATTLRIHSAASTTL